MDNALAPHQQSPWGVPDWRNASAYPTADTTPERIWRWEFLRRREDYRNDWHACKHETYEYFKELNGPEKTLLPDDPRFVVERNGFAVGSVGIA